LTEGIVLFIFKLVSWVAVDSGLSDLLIDLGVLGLFLQTS